MSDAERKMMDCTEIRVDMSLMTGEELERLVQKLADQQSSRPRRI